MRQIWRSSSLVLVASIGLPALADDPFADRVVGYVEGTGVGAGFNDPSTALGEPTRITSPGSSFGGATTPFQGAFGNDEIVSIGEGGSLTVEFDTPVTDDPLNPFGIDLLVFGNPFYFISNFPTGVADTFSGEGGQIEVSEDGVTFFVVPGVDADSGFPTLGFLDPSAPVTFGTPVTGTIESDFTKPVDPTFDGDGLSLSEFVTGYDGSGGGTGVDIGALGLSEISFVRITNVSGSGTVPEIDGFADVAPIPEPGTAVALGVLAAFGLSWRRRRCGC